MIGKIDTGYSFYGVLAYCLNDKRELSEEQKIAMSLADGLQHKNRAEVLEYNLCFGNEKELAGQFRDVKKLSKRVEKPVFHMTMRLAAGEFLSKDQLIDIGRACAKEFDVLDHQYVCILHKDTAEQHIHLIANRVGYDGLAAKDNNSYERMAKLSRRLEEQYHLRVVLSPRKFQSPEERLLPRHDSRKEKLKTDIRKTLEKARDYPSFVQQMTALGYQVFKQRGIYFIDEKKVRIKGSEVGYSLAKIEKVLALKATANIVEVKPANAFKEQKEPMRETEKPKAWATDIAPQQEYPGASTSLLEQLMQSEQGADYINPDLYKWPKRKRKKPKKRL